MQASAISAGPNAVQGLITDNRAVNNSSAAIRQTTPGVSIITIVRIASDNAIDNIAVAIVKAAPVCSGSVVENRAIDNRAIASNQAATPVGRGIIGNNAISNRSVTICQAAPIPLLAEVAGVIIRDTTVLDYAATIG